MPTIRIRSFRGIAPAVSPKLLGNDYAQIAHNTLLQGGVLRPYAKWQKQSAASFSANSILFNKKTNNIELSNLESAVKLTGAPFPPNGFAGIEDGIGMVVNQFSGFTYTMKLPVDDELEFDHVVTGSNNLSKKPVNRIYGYTIVRENGVGFEEGPITYIPPEVA